MLLGWSEVATGELLEGLFDRLAWVTRYSKGAVPLRDALGMPPSRAIDGWTLRMYEAALERLLAREQESGRRSENEAEGA